MPTKSARVSTECTIATHYYYNDTVYSDMKVKSVMLKLENDLHSLYERQVSFNCMSFHMAKKYQLGK